MKKAFTTALAVALCATACSRTDMEWDDDASGSAGTAAGGNGGSGGEGAGGPDDGWPCRLAASAAVGVEAGSGFHQRQPKLALSSDDGERVTMAFEWRNAGGPEPTASELRHVSFSPWEGLPKDELGLAYLADLDAGASFAIDMAAGDRFALLASDGENPNPPDGVNLLLGLVPGSGDLVPRTPIKSDGTGALFASVLGNKHLVGVATTTGPSEEMHLRVVTEVAGSVALGSLWPYGCSSRIVADAARSGAGWLVAVAAAGETLDECAALETDVATSVSLATVDASLGLPKPVATVGSSGEEIHRVLLAEVPSRSSAATWVVWSTASSLRAVLVDGLGSPLGDVRVIAQGPGLDPERVAATSAFGGLLVAYRLGERTLATFVADDEGDGVAEPAELPDLLPSDALASPSGPAVLVSGTTPVAGVDRARVALLRCTQ